MNTLYCKSGYCMVSKYILSSVHIFTYSVKSLCYLFFLFMLNSGQLHKYMLPSFCSSWLKMQTQQPAAPESFATFVFFKCYFLFSALLLKQLLLMVNIYSSEGAGFGSTGWPCSEPTGRGGLCVYRIDACCSVKSGWIAISQCRTLNKYQPYNNHHLVAEVKIKATTCLNIYRVFMYICI